ncbi:MAG: hypothetical protein A2289_07175 [Deltaproteobacteria bacterium RIFOXYA12_FULL_58_15]|nr:MAG: hypothetical protein A2289_07175 [Deltaproteobacteria bacterium RIFOXYA12_FULL_58_15]
MSIAHIIAEETQYSNVKLPLSKLKTALTHIERLMAEHYEWLALVFSTNAHATKFFADMARAEREHERLVELGFRLAGERLDLTVCVDVLDLRDTFAEVSRFRSITPRPTLKEALDFSRDLEKHAAEEHLGTALASVDPSLSDLIQRLGSDDLHHAKALRTFGEHHRPEAHIALSVN